MTGEIIAHSQDQTDQKQTDRTGQDRTRTELVQRYCIKCLGVTPHTRTYTYSYFAWPEPGVDTCDLCGRSP